ncbi:helix-turn-helix transcriptional regulator [Microbacterium paraoxydans]|uniref:helix-turn-helix domain-containing protein n=1 Tax=Microbacterium TaxID=33882 RepID=UPI000C803336|nr:helix-turn-helix transcriptional regulator [Microbacterium sp. UMB0228]PMC02359.1 transcriptional regulator [Microbacterium sp. UMB0228]
MNAEESPGFGDVIREARKAKGWSQIELGEAAGLSRPTIARIEANNDVTTATIAKVASALGLKLELRQDED